MRTLETSDTVATLQLHREEVRIICQALSEVCHALEFPEFSTRMGAEESEVELLLDRLQEIFPERE